MSIPHEQSVTGMVEAVEPACSLAFLAPALDSGEIGRLAHYRVIKLLGQGGMGIVLLAEDTQLQRPVALKVIRPEMNKSFANRQRFLREARAMAQVRSDHVVTIYQVGQAEDVCYLAMELLAGESLEQCLNRDHKPELAVAIRIGREVSLALAAAHSQGLVHRDVKPANIWLEAPSQRVKLLDFGLVRAETEAAHITNPGIVVGTPMFMAPEQATGDAVDGRADLFSLGCVLYRMAAGRDAFPGESALAVMNAVVTATPPPVRQFAPATPPQLNDLISRLLAKRPADRPASAEIVSIELQGIAQTLSSAANSSLVGAQQTHVGPGSHGPSAATPNPSRSHSLQPLDRANPTPPPAREAERRQVTVLICGTAFFESEGYLLLDAEDQVETLRVFRQTCGEVVERFDGTVVQCDERGLLACFGYPVAYEDAGRSAAHAGLALLEAVNAMTRRRNAEQGGDTLPWVGLHTGAAVVEADGKAVTLVGEARNLAVRLDDVATPGEVVCTEATHKLLRGSFESAALGSKKIKGVPRPVVLFRVKGIAVASSSDALARVELTPLTGRDLEVSLLKDRWEQSQEGVGQTVLLVGDPGLGKSRLVQTLKQHVMEQFADGEVDAPVIEWRCAPHFQNTGLYPAIDFYERALGLSREDPPEDRFNRLLRRLEAYDLARPETVPLWASLLSLPTLGGYAPLSLSPARQREETFRTMLDWLHIRAARKPVVIVVEDLHWADASTLELLGLYLAELADDRVLLVLTFRPEFQPPWPTTSNQTTLSLNRLTKRQSIELMQRQMGPAVPKSVLEQLYDRTGGVPLFVEEFTKMVQESINRDGANLSGTSAGLLAAREIPATLQDLMTARLDRMGSERDVAQLGAVLGREFGHDMIAAVTALDDATLTAEMAKLVRAEILSQKGRPPRCTYTFKHALLEDSLYNALVKSKRQQFHRRIGETLESRFAQTIESRPELAAHHFTEAGLTDKAITYWLRAGLQSRDRSSENEAIAQLTTGLQLLRTLEESPARDEWEMVFLTSLAPAYIAAQGYASPEVGPLLLRAQELGQRIDNPQQLLGITLGLWEWRIVRGNLGLCVDLAAEGMAIAERVNDPGMMMEALFMPGVTMFYRGQFAGARDQIEKALATYDDLEGTKLWTAYTGHNASVTHRCYLALTLWHLGYPDRALQVAHEMCELARTVGHAFTLCHAIDFAGVVYLNCRLGAEVLKLADQEIALATEQCFPFWHALGTLHRGAGLLLQDKRDEAQPLLQKGFNAFQATGAEIRVPRYFGMLADAYACGNRFSEAHTALDNALAVAEKNDDRTHEAELLRLKGELFLAESPARSADAEGYFHQAIETARRQQSRGWELRASVSLARLKQRQGNRDEARDTLAPIYASYSEGFTLPDLVDAKALLDALA